MVMKTKSPSRIAGRIWTAAELRRLPAAKRDAILMAAAKRAAPLYAANPELTAFEAFDDEENHGGGSNTEAR